MKTARLVLALLGLYLYVSGHLLTAQNTPPAAAKVAVPTTAVRSTTAAASGAPSASAPAPSAPAPSAGAGPLQPGAPIMAAVAYGKLAVQGNIANGGRIECVKYHFDKSRQVDANTGLPTGAAKPSQITITKHWDAASTQFLQALATNESLPTLTLEFLGGTSSTVGLAAGAKQPVLFTVTLTNASVVAVHQYMEDKGALEDVVLTFQKIELSGATKSTTVDNWNAGR